MKIYRLSSRLLSSVMIQKSRQTFTPQTLEHLPGSSVRGALAGLYLRTGGNADDNDFQKLFGQKGPGFPDLLPGSSPDSESGVLPLTAISCKRCPGFSVDGHHGVRDSLTMLALNRFSGKGVSDYWKCSVCNNDCSPFTGFYSLKSTEQGSKDPGVHSRETTTVELQRHTGIDRTTGTIAQGIFYTSQVMRDERIPGEPQLYTGRIMLDEEQYQLFKGLLERGPVFVGADRARGLGEIELGLEEISPEQVDIKNWSEQWTSKYRKETGRDLPQELYFSINLWSPAVLVDRFLRPEFNFNLDFPGVTMVGKAARKNLVRGWQAAWGLPKTDDVALERGSVFLFSYQGNNLEKLNSYLTEVERSGVGLRTQEGMGAVRICNPLHYKEIL